MAWVNAISWLTAAWLLLCSGRAVLDLSRGKRHSVLFLVLVHLLFCGAPLLWDVTIGRPGYGIFSGFYIASQDPATVSIYCVYVAAVPVVLYLFGRASLRPSWSPNVAAAYTPQVSNGPRKRLNLLLWIAIVAPVIAAAASPRRDFYLSYGAMATEELGDLEQYHSFVGALCLVAIVSGVGVLLTARSLSKRLFITLGPWLISACWLFGKRTIVAVLVLGLVYVWWYRGLLMGRRFVLALGLGAMFVAAGSYGYQRVIRQMSAREFETYYSNARVDFGRDGGIQQAIHAELGSESDQILEYRGQSLLFYLVMYVPRAAWPEKPWPYAVYQTARALNLPVTTTLNWGVTTSWLDEAIANCGWFGLLVGPLSLALFCRVGDRTGDPFTRYVTVCIGTLLMAVQLAAFSSLAIVWVMSCVWQYGPSSWGLRRGRFEATLPRQPVVANR
jgi:hypothetical protein